MLNIKVASNDKSKIETNACETLDVPNGSGNWILTDIIYIDGEATGVGAHNWTWAESQDWFSGGDGSELDPYFIGNISLIVDDVESAFSIVNSDVHFSIQNLTIENPIGTGIYFENLTNGFVDSCIIHNIGVVGVYFVNVSDTIITANIYENAVYGIYWGIALLSCTNVTIISCDVYEADGRGVFINLCNDIHFELIDLWNNSQSGVYCVNSNSTTFTTMKCYNNSLTGMSLVNCINNTISDCEFEDNVGIGLVVKETAPGKSSGNIIFNNYFGDNLADTEAQDNCSVANLWDNGSRGNYWHDYGGYDGNDDGIGDVVYKIPGTAGAEDRFPIFTDGPEPTPVLDEEEDDKDSLIDGNDAQSIDTRVIIPAICVCIGIVAIVAFIYFSSTKNPKIREKRIKIGRKFKTFFLAFISIFENKIGKLIFKGNKE